MARPSSVWWWGARKRWTINVGGKRKTAPAKIGQHDVKAAEKWARDLLAAESPDRLPKEARTCGRLRKEFLLRPVTLKRLRRLVLRRRGATDKRVDASRILEKLIDDAYRTQVAAQDQPAAGGAGGAAGGDSDDGAGATLD